MDKFLATQKLDPHDIERAIHLYYNIILSLAWSAKSIANPELLHNYYVLQSLLQNYVVVVMNCCCCDDVLKSCKIMLLLGKTAAKLFPCSSFSHFY